MPGELAEPPFVAMACLHHNENSSRVRTQGNAEGTAAHGIFQTAGSGDGVLLSVTRDKEEAHRKRQT
jgi:hypothetical protein